MYAKPNATVLPLVTKSKFKSQQFEIKHYYYFGFRYLQKNLKIFQKSIPFKIIILIEARKKKYEINISTQPTIKLNLSYSID